MFTIHTLLVLFIVLAIVGIILWGVQSLPGIPPVVKTVIIVLVCVALLLYALQYVGGGSMSLRR
jgi:hypothetical protein